jgi:eukaryotic-like serine/threonine-protein kinase
MTDNLSTDSFSPELLALQRAVVGRYSIVRELGRGGMGIVVLARDVALERPVAIKLLPPSMAMVPEHRHRFVREARTAAALAHPNIVPIHAVEDGDSAVFFVMAFVDGETLAQRVSRAGPLGGTDAVRIIQEVSWALAHAHANGVVHRDIKPENILIERGTGRAIVTDFGIAWVGNKMSTSGEGKIVGTPRYMSPEQARGETVTGRSDIYSLGAVAYLATSGRAPIDGSSAAVILTKQVTETPASLAVVRRDLPARLVAAIDRCLAKDPAARWTSAEELATALRSIGGMGIDVAPLVRAYLRDVDDVGGEVETAITVGVTSLLMLSVMSAVIVGDDLGSGFRMIMASAVYVTAAASMTGLAGWRVSQLVAKTRRLLRGGYAHSAVKSALASRDAEYVELAGKPPRSTLRVLAGGVAATAVSLLLMNMSDWWPVFGLAGSIIVPAATIRRLLRASETMRNWWSRLMRGTFGARLFRLAGVGVERRRSAIPAAGEPTSVALGDAVVALFAALSTHQRKQFSQLPDLVSNLERAADEARRLAPGAERNERVVVAVAALETLRLDLLRLHADGSSTDDLTRDLEAAVRIGDAIAAHIARAPDHTHDTTSRAETPLPST